MHGVVFAALRDYSVVRLGEEGARALWEDRTFDPSVAYEDAWFVAQLDRLVAATGAERRDVERDFGVFAARVTFTALFPDYYAASADTADFLLGIEERIHDVVRETIPGSAPPRLHVRPLDDLGVLVSYTSERMLCGLLEGLVVGTAAELGDSVEVEEIQCMHAGDTGCVFTVVRSPA
jgi:hypothetical protein